MTERPCAQCGAPNPTNSRFCIACGAKIEGAPPPPPPSPPPESKATIRVCPRCGKENPAAAKFCIQCGASPENAAATPPPPPDPVGGAGPSAYEPPSFGGQQGLYGGGVAAIPVPSSPAERRWLMPLVIAGGIVVALLALRLVLAAVSGSDAATSPSAPAAGAPPATQTSLRATQPAAAPVVQVTPTPEPTKTAPPAATPTASLTPRPLPSATPTTRATATSTVPRLTPYADPQGRFTVDWPAGNWQVSEYPNGAVPFYLGDVNRTSFVVEPGLAANVATAGELVDLNLMGMRQFNQVQILKRDVRPPESNGVSGGTFTVLLTSPQGGRQTYTHSFVLIATSAGGGVVYGCAYYALDEEYDRLLPTFQAMAASLEFADLAQ